MISCALSRLWTAIGAAALCTYVAARYRRLRTPKELRDADFHLWVANLNKCAGCFYLDPIPNRPTCDLCGCNVESKTRWMSEKCPIEEWDNTIHLKSRLEQLSRQAQHPTNSTKES